MPPDHLFGGGYYLTDPKRTNRQGAKSAKVLGADAPFPLGDLGVLAVRLGSVWGQSFRSVWGQSFISH